MNAWSRELEKNKEALERANRALQSTREELEARGYDLNRAKRHLQISRDSQDTVVEVLGIATEARLTAEAELEETREALEETREALESSRKELMWSQMNTKSLRGRAETREAELRESRAELDRERGGRVEASRMRVELGEAEDQIEQMDKNIEELERDRGIHLEEIESLCDQLDEAEQRLERQVLTESTRGELEETTEERNILLELEALWLRKNENLSDQVASLVESYNHITENWQMERRVNKRRAELERESLESYCQKNRDTLYLLAQLDLSACSPLVIESYTTLLELAETERS